MKKPGYKTTEFWFALAASILAALGAADFIPEDSVWGKVIALGLSVLGALGYGAYRTFGKAADSKTDAALALSAAGLKVDPSPPSKLE